MQFGGFLRERIDSPVYIGVMLLIEIFDSIDYLPWFLCRGCVVEVDQRVAIYSAIKNWKILANSLGIYDCFYSPVFSLFDSDFASSSSSIACFSSKVSSLGTQLGITSLS